MITLIRVKYGKKHTAVNEREFQIDGKGPVGTIAEFKQHFGNQKLHVIDAVNGEDYEVE